MIREREKKKKKKQYSQRITCDRKFGIFRWLRVKIHLSVQEIQMMQALSLGQEDLWKEEIATHFKYPSEKAMTPHSSTLAWKIPWTEEPGRLQSMGSRRVGHGWATSLSFFTFVHWRRKWQPTPVFLPGESQGWGSLVGCRLWVHTESDTTEVT